MKLRNVSFVLVIFLVIILNLFLDVSDSGDRKPNIVFIFTDDLGYDHLGCYGQEKIILQDLIVWQLISKKETTWLQCTLKL